MADENPTDILEALPAAEAARTAVRAGASLMLVAHSPPGAAEAASAAASGASAAGAAGIAKLGVAGLAVILLVGGALANVAAFLIYWPKTPREAFTRVVATMMGSALLGPFLWAGTAAKAPWLFDSARAIAGELGLPEVYGMAVLAINLACAAGLPFWWLLGAVLLWLDRRKGKDLGELARDARADVAEVMKP